MNMRYRGLAIVAVLSIILAAACAASVDDGADAAVGDTILLDGVRYSVTNELPKEAKVVSLESTGHAGAVKVKADVNGYAVLEIVDYAFKDCTKVTSIELPEPLKKIGNGAFEGCSSITGITVPKNVTEIGDSAFKDCMSIKKISIPATTETIGDGAFMGCALLSQFEVTAGMEAATKHYSVNDGVLLNEGETEIICCPAAKADGYTIPSTVTEIPAHAFDGSKIKTVTIPKKVSIIGEGAFSNCDDLTAIIVEAGNVGEYKSDLYGVLYKSGTLLQCPSDYSGTHKIRSDTTRIGNSAYEGCTKLTSVAILGDGLVTVGDSSFEGCTALKSITVGESANALKTIGKYSFRGCGSLAVIDLSKVDSMGEGAFEGCTSLSSADLSALGEINASSFSGCTSLATVKLHNRVSIGVSAFEGCTSLTMQESVQCNTDSVGASAFKGCTSLKFFTLSLDANNATIDKSAFEGCTGLAFVKISGTEGKTVTVNERAFKGCANLVSFTFDERVSSVGESSFEGCSMLQDVTLSSVATDLEKRSFKGCVSLESLNMGSVTNVPEGCFEGCVSLDAVVWGSVTDVGVSAFSGCTSITSVALSNNIKTIEDNAFKGCTSLEKISWESADSLISIGNGAFGGCTSITSVALSDNTETIGDNAFKGCTSLTTVTAGGIKTVGDGAFDGCSALTTYLGTATAIGDAAYRSTALSEAVMGNTVSVGQGAFEGCTALASVTLSTNVLFTNISESMFKGCTKIVDIKIPASVQSIGSNAFKGCTSLSKVEFAHLSDPLPALDKLTSFDCGTSSHPVSLTFSVGSGTSSNFLPVNTDYTTITLGGSSTFTVFYNANGGTGTAQGTSVPSNGTAHLNASGISRSGYRLMGWSTTPGGAVVESVQNVTANMTVYAVWEKEYTITYDKNGGTGTTESEKTVAHKVYYLKESTAYIKANFIFLGWATAKESTETTDYVITPAKDTTVYAVWGAAVKITYDKNGGAGEAYSDSTLKGNPYTLPIGCRYTNDGYMFGGWSKTADGKSPITKVDGTADITVFATWTDMSYKITYKANGGTGTHAADTVAKGASFTLDTIPEFTKDGYYFVGWSDSSSGKTIIKTLEKVTSDQTVYAIWTDTQFTVTYNANGGTGTHAADKVAKGGSITLDTTTSFKRSGYAFSGWSLTPTGAAVKTLEGVSADTTVYAIWKIIYTVSFDANGGTGTQSPIRATEGSMSQLYGSTTFVGPSGKEFKGWSRTADSTDTVASVLMSDNITMYAVWGASTSSDNPDVGDDPSTSSEGGWQVPVMVAVPLALLGVTAGLIWYRTGRI